jgi:hypothetical protein
MPTSRPVKKWYEELFWKEASAKEMVMLAVEANF